MRIARPRTCPTFALAVVVACCSLAWARPASARRKNPVKRANALLARLTLEEKIALAAAGGAGVPRLGIPGLVPSDGPNGVRLGAPGATAFPNAQVVAASWDRALAKAFGTAMGAEAAGKGFNVLLGPTVNILRTPKWGRAAETLGEDPYLAGQIAAAEIEGIQRQHVIAQVKHFAANNQEIERLGNPIGLSPLSPAIDVHVSERALREIYFPAFKAAVQEGGVGSVMCAYPRVNGVYPCQSPFLLGTLKDEWGFPGFVGPDAVFAVRDARAAIDAGTDNFQLGNLGGDPTVALSETPIERLDDMVRRILTAMASVGLLDHPATGEAGAVVSTPEHLALATEIAAQGSVLLKNDAGILPLGADVRSVAVIGDDAASNTQTTLGGSAAVMGGPVVTPLAGITARAGAGVAVTYAPGTLGVVPLPTVPADVLTPSAGTGPGLFCTQYATSDWSGSPLGAFVVPTVTDAALLAGVLSARCSGTLTPGATGLHRFAVRYAGIVHLFVDGSLVASGDSQGLDYLLPAGPILTAQGVADLTAAVPVPITIEWAIGSSFAGAVLDVGWQPPDPTLVPEATAAASAADVAVVFVDDATSEGMDRASLALPGDQDQLIEAVAAANPRTIVVLHTAGPVLMPWLPQVAGVIAAWYPGERSGAAIAAVLFGDLEPSGRLPMTFPASQDQGPATQPAEYPGVAGVVQYDEDIDVGYRFYDRMGEQPLFPFGYGLSYTSFSVDQLRVKRRHDGTYRVAMRVRNTGERKGAAVVQIYVGFPASTGEPPNQLKGFAKVVLRPGRRKRVKMTLDPSSFATWSATESAWVVEPGEYRIRAGTSSRDLPEEVSVVVGGAG
jgi:beta-glucosidase